MNVFSCVTSGSSPGEGRGLRELPAASSPGGRRQGGPQRRRQGFRKETHQPQCNYDLEMFCFVLWNNNRVIYIHMSRSRAPTHLIHKLLDHWGTETSPLLPLYLLKLYLNILNIVYFLYICVCFRSVFNIYILIPTCQGLFISEEIDYIEVKDLI